ncbi:MAG: hypothetical protein Fur0041_15870 [Bacteroidia bacterium]
MRKSTVLVAALALSASAAFAQVTNKNGVVVTPEAGDWAIGFDAAPFLNYFGNMANGATNAPFSANFINGTDQMIMGKYYASETMAYRGLLRIGFGSTTMGNYVVKDGTTATPPEMVTDEMKSSYNFIGLGAGVEMRRGKTRLQGYYGGQFMFMIGGSKDTYTYGNAFGTTNTTPTTTVNFLTGTTAPVSSRTLEAKAGSMFGLGLRGFIGAEYFILPKLSIGAEYGWGLALSSTGEGSVSTESWNGTGTVTTETKTAKSSSFGIDTDNNPLGRGSSGSIIINLHF